MGLEAVVRCAQLGVAEASNCGLSPIGRPMTPQPRQSFTAEPLWVRAVLKAPASRSRRLVTMISTGGLSCRRSTWTLGRTTC
jgi:hypothetical protein